MADSKNQSSPILVILCTLGLLAFLLLVIYPNYRIMKDYDRQISGLKEEIALRQSLAPLYGKLIKKVRIAPSTQLTSPEPTSLDIKHPGRLTQVFQEIAQTAGLEIESVVPDAQAFKQGSGRIAVDVVFRGDFLSVQPLVHTILEQPFVDRIQGIQIQRMEKGKWINLSVSVFHS
jgi:hypothetical protein